MAIWSKGGDTPDALVHAFTVADDWRHDRVLAPYDLLGSGAHAVMLDRIGLLPAGQLEPLVAALRQLHGEFLAGAWTVEPADEDVHSKVEALLTARIGEPARRLHTGRSRNDQVLTDLRLWQKDVITELALATAIAARALLAQAKTYEFHPLPGYTHLQRAMPSSVGMFFASHAHGLADDLILLAAAYELVDACPLGSGASYGVGLPLDRQLTADLLGFSRFGAPAMADANGRGKVETAVLDALGAVMTDLARFAADLVFFTSVECGFFTLGKGFTTGSSIMPQKRNPDLCELLRARAATFLGLRTGLAAIVTGLPSGYSRDLQDTKALVMQGVDLARQALAVATAVTPTIAPARERIVAALTPDLYATDAAYRLVEQGVPFRDAYIQVGRNLGSVAVGDHDAVVRSRTHAGSTGNLGLDRISQRLDGLQAAWSDRRAALHRCWTALLGEASP